MDIDPYANLYHTFEHNHIRKRIKYCREYSFDIRPPVCFSVVCFSILFFVKKVLFNMLL